MPPPTICLNMIVRDEAPVIGRCLDSVLPFIDSWVIVDTGSTDGTQDLVRQHLASRPGELHERPWQDFGTNRNEALALARSHADYLFFIDADERLALSADFRRPTVEADGYHLDCEYDGTSYKRCALIAARLPWRWEGVVHEYLACDQAYQLAELPGPVIVVAHDGQRSRNPDTYAHDAVLLEQALHSDPNNARNVFYLAQSYRDCGQLARSRELYRRRAQMGGWDEEVWFSVYQVAVLGERLGLDPGEVSFGYLSAFQLRPTRAEPLVQLARYHRERGDFGLALLYARHAVSIPRPNDLLFVEDAAYAWRALDELSIAAYYAGAKSEGRIAINKLLAEDRLPSRERARICRNQEFYDNA